MMKFFTRLIFLGLGSVGVAQESGDFDITVPQSEGMLSQAIGIETIGGIFTPWIDAGTGLPASVQKTFSTAVPDQRDISLFFFHGNENMIADNIFLNNITVSGFQNGMSPRGLIIVEMAIDAGGVVTFSAFQNQAPLVVQFGVTPKGPSPFTVSD